MNTVSHPLEVAALRIQQSGCNRCPDLAAIRSRIVTHRGNPASRICVIGQNPGASEDKMGRPFVGKSGQLLDAIFALAGLNTQTDTFVTNAALCLTPGNAEPTAVHLANCRSHLTTLTSSFPILILVGRVAAVAGMEAYCPGWNMMRMGMGALVNGGPYALLSGSRAFIVYHPSYLLRQGVRPDVLDPKHPLVERMVGILQRARDAI